MKPALIIFVRNPELGKVKTRLARTLGNDAALNIYKKLLHHTYSIVCKADYDKFIFYADYINENDLWENGVFKKLLQGDGDLGEKMQSAFETVFALGYKKVLIIGSDCYELTSAIISDAFTALDTVDVVIGPSFDGGYYLLGSNQLLPFLFTNKEWSTSTVCSDTIAGIERCNKTYHLLTCLNDVDEEKDVPEQLLS